jgi:hypothetical protein
MVSLPPSVFRPAAAVVPPRSVGLHLRACPDGSMRGYWIEAIEQRCELSAGCGNQPGLRTFPNFQLLKFRLECCHLGALEDGLAGRIC